MMKDFFQGKWFGHPLHPILAHLPMALWPAALIFDLLAYGGIGGNAMVRTSFYAIIVGLLVALLAIPAGLADWIDVKRNKPAWKWGLFHLLLNLVVVMLWAINLGLRWEPTLDAATVPLSALILSAVGTLLLFGAGYLGGKMIYDYGINVARTSKRKWRKVAKAGGARLPSE